MGRLFILRVARLCALVMSAVKFALANIATVKRSLEPFVVLSAKRLLGVFTLKARYLLLETATVAFGINHHRTVATKTRVAKLLAQVFTTRHQILTRLLAAPAIFVIRLSAKLLRSILAAETRLDGSRQVTGRTGSSVTLERTRVRTGASRF